MSRPAPALSLQELVERSERALADAGVPSPRVDAELLVAHFLGTSRGGLQAQVALGHSADDELASAVAAAVDRRATREPLQHITGLAPFRSLELLVGPGVFVPRPETEQVTQLAVDALAAVPSAQPVAVDLGTGSGAIALALAAEVPHAAVHAVERGPAAFAWAQRNLDRLRASGGPLGEVRLLLGDLADAFGDLDGSVDVVISNPPYIPTGMVPVDPEVRLYDPPAALYGGEDGMDAVHDVSRTGLRLLRPGGVLVIEHGELQAAQVAALLAADGWRAIAGHRDATTRDRATTALR